MYDLTANIELWHLKLLPPQGFAIVGIKVSSQGTIFVTATHADCLVRKNEYFILRDGRQIANMALKSQISLEYNDNAYCFIGGDLRIWNLWGDEQIFFLRHIRDMIGKGKVKKIISNNFGVWIWRYVKYSLFVHYRIFVLNFMTKTENIFILDRVGTLPSSAIIYKEVLIFHFFESSQSKIIEMDLLSGEIKAEYIVDYNNNEYKLWANDGFIFFCIGSNNKESNLDMIHRGDGSRCTILEIPKGAYDIKADADEKLHFHYTLLENGSIKLYSFSIDPIDRTARKKIYSPAYFTSGTLSLQNGILSGFNAIKNKINIENYINIKERTDLTNWRIGESTLNNFKFLN